MPLPPKKVLKDLEFLKSSGFAIPDALVDYVSSEDDKNQGVKKVFLCEKCSSTYKSFVNITAISCPQGHSMKLLREY